MEKAGFRCRKMTGCPGHLNQKTFCSALLEKPDPSRMPPTAPYLRSVRSVSAVPFQKKIGLCNAAICYLCPSDVKWRVFNRIITAFWRIITSWPEKWGNPSSIRARKRAGLIWGRPLPFADPGPGRYDPAAENTPESGPDSRFWIPFLPGKALKTSRLGSRGKHPQITPCLPKYARFRCQITGSNRVLAGDLFATSNHPCDPEIGQKNAAIK
jgi:hypothetical protein